MRELKFRAWDVESECYIDEKDWAGITPEGQNIWVVEEEEVSVLPILGEFIIEQYTGLKDKNGKEIYEGDIAEALIDGVWTTGSNDALFGKRAWRLKVYWDEMRYAFMWHILGSKTCPDRVYDLYDRKITEVEVIGNIHDNHKLLGEEEE